MAGVRGLLTINKREKGLHGPGSQSIAALSKRGSQLPNLPPVDVLEKMEFTEDLPGNENMSRNWAEDKQREEEEVRNIFENHDADGKDGLNAAEFSRALKEMEMGIPAALTNHLFNQIDTNSNGIISFREFLDFVYDDHLLEFDEDYWVDFDGKDFGLTLEVNPETNSVTVVKLDDKVKSEILPGSEVVKINDEHMSDILDDFGDVSDSPDTNTLVHLKKYLDKLKRPVRIHFKMEVMGKVVSFGPRQRLGVVAEPYIDIEVKTEAADL